MIEYATVLMLMIVIGNAFGWSYISSLLETTQKLVETLSSILKFIFKLPYYFNEFRRSIETLAHKRNTLDSKARDMRTEASTAEDRTGKQCKGEVLKWLEDAQRISNEVQMILEQDNQEMNKFYKFLYRAWLSCHVKKKIRQVDELLQFGTDLQMGSLVSAARTLVPLVTSELIGRAAPSKVDEILSILNLDEISCIGFHGAEGTGKTEILVHIYNQLLVNQNVYYAQIKENSTAYNLQSRIASTLQLKLTEEDEMIRKSIVHRALLRKREFVLILDGTSSKLKDLDDVGIPIHPNGGKLIVATRSLDLCIRLLGFQRTRYIELHPLSDDEAGELFRHRVQLYEYHSPEMRDIANCIIRKCGNVPGKIMHVAGKLRGEHNINVWENTWNELC